MAEKERMPREMEKVDVPTVEPHLPPSTPETAKKPDPGGAGTVTEPRKQPDPRVQPKQ